MPEKPRPRRDSKVSLIPINLGQTTDHNLRQRRWIDYDPKQKEYITGADTGTPQQIYPRSQYMPGRGIASFGDRHYYVPYGRTRPPPRPRLKIWGTRALRFGGKR